jgi:hypothetical protein
MSPTAAQLRTLVAYRQQTPRGQPAQPPVFFRNRLVGMQVAKQEVVLVLALSEIVMKVTKGTQA